MRKIIVSILCCLLIFPCLLEGQRSFFIEGKVVDKETREPLPAYILEEEGGTGCTAESNGYFKLAFKRQQIPKTLKLSVWLIGYKKKEIEAKIGEYLNVELELEPIQAHEIVVTADSIVSDGKSQKTVTMKKMDIYTTPGAAADPLYASQILPGVNSLPDASSLLIRGGAPDEVGYFFDGVEVDHPFLSESLHESYFSIFDNQIIESFNVSTSGFHPKYGDALSGVMDIAAKDTIAKGEGGLGLSILGLNSYIGWPLAKSISFVGSYDRGFSELLTALNSRSGDRKFRTEHAFGKFVIRLNPSNQVRVYGLVDRYTYSEPQSFDVSSRNTLAALSWTFTPRQNFVSKALVSGTGYDVTFKIEDSMEIHQKDDMQQARWDAIWDLERHFLEFGADVQRRSLETAISDPDPHTYRARGTRLGFYLNDKVRISDRIFMNLGGRASYLDLAQSKWGLDPRLSIAWLLTPKDIFRLAAGTYHQFGDYFVLIRCPELRPKDALHLALSYDHIGKETELRASIYDKEYQHLFLNLPDGAVGDAGKGYARGAEFFIKKMNPRYDAIFVYNFLHSRRRENDATVLSPSPYEVSHSLTGIFKWKWKTWSLGFRYSYASGRPYTPLAGREWDSQSEAYLPIWGDPYSERYPAYQRMDINGSKILNIWHRLIVIYFGITNVLDNDNILRYEYASDYSGRMDQQSIFGRSLFVGIYVPFF